SKNFTMVICDEGHLLDDYGARGLSYELLLSRFKKENNKKFIFLSAIIPNIIEINKWLGGDEKDVAKSNYRATEIEYAFLKPDKSGKKFHLEVNPLSSLPKKYILNNFLTEKDLQYTEQLKTKIKTRIDTSFQSKSAIIALKALHSGTVAIFVPKKGYKGGVEGVTKEIIRQLKNKSTLFNDLNLQKPTDDKIILKKYFQIIFGDEYLLTQIIDYGILFHHGDLPQYVREIIEDYIRDEKIKLIICTNTLAEGVNLPIRTIIVNSTRRDHRLNPDLRDLKNLFGRAGRAGKETKGLIIIPNPNDFQIVKNVIKGENIQEVKGFLYKIIQIIEKYAKAEKLILTNDFLEEQNEDFKELIESIDTSIIDLLEESIDIEKFDGEIQNLINNTFASYQANKEEKNILNILIKLRGEKIKPYIKTEEFSFIKKSSSTLRIYEELKSKLELTNPIWKETNTPTNEKWLNFIVSIISELSIVKYRLELFNKKNFQTKKSEYLTFEDIKTAITLWLKGKWFKDISTICSNDINISLRLIKFITEYNIQNVISTIIHIVELKLKTESKVISQVILDFPQYLLYGLEERLQLDLIEIGFTDRIGIIELSRMTNKVEYSKLRELKSILKYNEEEIISFLKNKLPQLSLAKIKDSFNFLRYDNIQ
ncbi:MAG: hypothetical protein KAT05_07155, partial [Spirochaetes bacterium]|nr:hypothetical protein [Spirochaetota bacterium]